MSRNLLSTCCNQCGADCVRMTGPVRDISAEDARAYLNEFRGLRVADAECAWCRTKYLAWVSPQRVHRYWPFRAGHDMDPDGADGFYDLSYRSTFDDEPGEADLPAGGVERVADLVKMFQTDPERAQVAADVLLQHGFVHAHDVLRAVLLGAL